MTNEYFVRHSFFKIVVRTKGNGATVYFMFKFLYSVRRNVGLRTVLVGKPKGKNHLEKQDIVGRMILKCIFKKYDGYAWVTLFV